MATISREFLSREKNIDNGFYAGLGSISAGLLFALLTQDVSTGYTVAFYTGLAIATSYPLLDLSVDMDNLRSNHRQPNS